MDADLNQPLVYMFRRFAWQRTQPTGVASALVETLTEVASALYPRSSTYYQYEARMFVGSFTIGMGLNKIQ